MNTKIMTAALAFATVMMMAPSAADAAPYWPWCSRYYWPRGGAISCAFVSWEQCMETVSGIGGLCYQNPYPNPYTPTPGRPAKPRRHAAR
jgi:Protein of unknown function (DUF3551)